MTVSVILGAVVGREDDQCVLVDSRGFQLIQDAAHRGVQFADEIAENSAVAFSLKFLIGIDGTVRADRGEIGEEGFFRRGAASDERFRFGHPVGDHLFEGESRLLKSLVVVRTDDMGRNVSEVERFGGFSRDHSVFHKSPSRLGQGERVGESGVQRTVGSRPSPIDVGRGDFAVGILQVPTAAQMPLAEMTGDVTSGCQHGRQGQSIRFD